MASTDTESLYRQIPAVDAVIEQAEALRRRYPREVIALEVRRLQGLWREHIRTHGTLPEPDFLAALGRTLAELEVPSLRRVINATGVILHTNLGRAPLAKLDFPVGYSNLEFNLADGVRGKRDVHCATLLERVLGAASVVVNNNAAATYLVLRAIAAGKEIVVSRGELIEIGDGFRIPEIMAQAGVLLREVGTTNRTHLRDYADAINENTALIVRVHASNFRMEGFTARPELAELAELAHSRGIPVYDDLGSGNLVDLHTSGIEEPLASQSLADGADLVSFSGDKLLGGPQAGIVAGRANLVGLVRKHPMYRAFRVDKLILQTLEGTLRALYLQRFDEIPALRMIFTDAGELRARVEDFARTLVPLPVSVIEGRSKIGGGSTPEQSLPSTLLAIKHTHPDRAAVALRERNPAIVCRIENDMLILDLRTVLPDEEPALREALRETIHTEGTPAEPSAPESGWDA